MFTIEWAPNEYVPRWKTSTERFDCFSEAADAGAEWMTANYLHGVDIQIRVVAVEVTEAPALKEAA